MKLRRRLIEIILISTTLCLAVVAIDAAWPDGIQSAIHRVVEFIRYGPDETDPFVAVGLWLIAYWFFVVLAIMGAAWLSALIIAMSDSSTSSVGRLIWGMTIFFASIPAVMIYCAVMLLRPENPSTSNPRGSA